MIATGQFVGRGEDNKTLKFIGNTGMVTEVVLAESFSQFHHQAGNVYVECPDKFLVYNCYSGKTKTLPNWSILRHIGENAFIASVGEQLMFVYEDRKPINLTPDLKLGRDVQCTESCVATKLSPTELAFYSDKGQVWQTTLPTPLTVKGLYGLVGTQFAVVVFDSAHSRDTILMYDVSDRRTTPTHFSCQRIDFCVYCPVTHFLLVRFNKNGNNYLLTALYVNTLARVWTVELPSGGSVESLSPLPLFVVHSDLNGPMSVVHYCVTGEVQYQLEPCHGSLKAISDNELMRISHTSDPVIFAIAEEDELSIPVFETEEAEVIPPPAAMEAEVIPPPAAMEIEQAALPVAAAPYRLCGIWDVLSWCS